MKRIFIILGGVLCLAGCTSSTKYGPCIGALTERKPNLIYEVDVVNVATAFVFSETIFVPLIVFLDQTRCPIGEKL